MIVSPASALGEGPVDNADDDEEGEGEGMRSVDPELPAADGDENDDGDVVSPSSEI